MTTAIDNLPKASEAWNLPEAAPLNEGTWQKWIARGETRARRGTAARLAAMKWISIAALAVAASIWPDLALFETVIKVIVTAGAMVVMLHFSEKRQYIVAGVFGALVLLYNPVMPVFAFAGEWQRAVVVVSIAPFGASLALAEQSNEHPLEGVSPHA